MHKSFVDTNIHLNRSMDSSDQNAQRTEGSAGSGQSTGASHVPRAPTPPPEPEHRPQVEQLRFRSEKFTELRQLGAIDFYGTTDPAEAGTWLKRTARVLGRMNCTFGSSSTSWNPCYEVTLAIGGRLFKVWQGNHRFWHVPTSFKNSVTNICLRWLEIKTI